MPLVETQTKKVNPEAFHSEYWKKFASIYWPDLKSCQSGLAECAISLRRGKADRQIIKAKMQAIEEIKASYLQQQN